MKDGLTFFDFAAEVGLTKHIGGLEATDQLMSLCHIDAGKRVLDVGCGVGVTPVYIARKYGVHVTGVDISPKMIERSIERARRERVADKVELRVVDAQELPFDDNTFDAVITESVIALVDDQQKAVGEFARVVKPGGYVGLNETAWFKVPPPPEVLEWAAQDVGANIAPQTPEVWQELLETAGLVDLTTWTQKINTRQEVKGLLQRYGFLGMVRIYSRIIALYARCPAYREFLKGVREVGVAPENIDEYLGYGLFVGRKPDPAR